MLLAAGAATAGDSLTVVSWGGAYETSQRKAYFEPFTAQTGIAVNVERYEGGIDGIRAQVASGNVTWDVVDLEMADTLQACEAGLLEPIDHGKLLPA